MSNLKLLPQSRDDKLHDAWLDFLLSRQAMNLSQQTLDFYRYTAGKFVEWLSDEAGIIDSAEVRSHHIRVYMVSLRERGLSDGSVRSSRTREPSVPWSAFGNPTTGFQRASR